MMIDKHTKRYMSEFFGIYGEDSYDAYDLADALNQSSDGEALTFISDAIDYVEDDMTKDVLKQELIKKKLRLGDYL